jgi:hypothetical protein
MQPGGWEEVRMGSGLKTAQPGPHSNPTHTPTLNSPEWSQPQSWGHLPICSSLHERVGREGRTEGEWWTGGCEARDDRRCVQRMGRGRAYKGIEGLLCGSATFAYLCSPTETAGASCPVRRIEPSPPPPPAAAAPAAAFHQTQRQPASLGHTCHQLCRLC